MKLSIWTASACLAALGLAGCNQAGPYAANSKICADFKAKTVAGPPGVAADGAAPVDECVRRWAYSLAPSTDDADTVSEAVVAACSTQLSRWNQQALAQGPAGQALSILTGEPTTPLAEHNGLAHARALFYVVQARAGRCPAPPVKDGVPEGVPG